MNEFKGRVIVEGDTEGEVMVMSQGRDVPFSLRDSVMRNEKGFIDSGISRESCYMMLTDKVICLHGTDGATVGGAILRKALMLGIAPRAMLFSDEIDPLATAGVVLSKIWLNEKIITIDLVGDDFIKSVKNGQRVCIKEDGSISLL